MTKREKIIHSLDCCSWGVKCSFCPYKDEPECKTVLMCDTLNLLKEQEPRVLTVEEISNNNIETAYFETKAGMLRGCIIEPSAICESYFYIICGLDDDVYWRNSIGYNITWRCWSSRPTPEQMRDTEWKEDSDVETS